MKTNKLSLFLVSLLAITGLMCTSCGSGNSFYEPQDAIDGYALEVNFNKWKIFNLDGTEVFEDKMITKDDGEQFNGSRVSFNKYVSASVNGFYKIGHPDHMEKSLLSKELGNDGKPVFLGPYKYVGMFYEDIAPAVKEGEGIIYIDRKGETVFDLNERTGLDVSYAYNFMGGLSVIGIYAESEIPLYGAINTKGKVVIEPKYLTLDYFGSGLYYAIDAQKIQSNDRDEWDVDILDNTGKIMFSFKKKDYYIRDVRYSGSITTPYFTFKDGYGVLSDYFGADWIIVDREGKELLKSDGTKILDEKCRSGRYFAFIDVESRARGIMDINGKVVIPAEYESIVWLDKEMFCGVKDRNRAVFDYNGKLLFTQDYGSIMPFNNGYSCILTQGQCQFINTKWETIKDQSMYNIFHFIYYDNELLEPVVSDKR